MTTDLSPVPATTAAAPATAMPPGRVPVDWRRMRSPLATVALVCSLVGAIGTASGSMVAGRLAEDASSGLIRLLALCVIGAALLDTVGRTLWAGLVDRAEGRLRADLLDSAMAQPLAELSELAVGEVLDRIDDDTHEVGVLQANTHSSAPLAVRMRPRTLDELVGQSQLRAEGSPLRQLIEGGRALSLLLWGPPGTGKTTIAAIVSQQTDRAFVEVSAVSAGVKEVRAAIEQARSDLTHRGRETVLFVDEVHRFSKAQQDALLPGVENRWVTLVAATTENPFFSVISPLLSRSLLLQLDVLSDDDIAEVIERALVDERGLGGELTLDDDARDHLIRLAGGDARRSLTYLEAAAGAARTRQSVPADGPIAIDLATAETAVDRAAVRYDRQGDQHYDVTSAFIKSVRGSDADAALHYLARMFEAGEDPRFIARRLVILASEDIGLADPTALTTAVAAAQAVQLIGMPEARLNLAQATIALAVAPKSNAVIKAIEAASADVRAGKIGRVPPHLRDAHYQGSKALGHGTAYTYSHDEPYGIAEQQYAPDVVSDQQYYQPTSLGAEAAVKERWERIRRLVRGR